MRDREREREKRRDFEGDVFYEACLPTSAAQRGKPRRKWSLRTSLSTPAAMPSHDVCKRFDRGISPCPSPPKPRTPCAGPSACVMNNRGIE